jgi:hypothetical protein
MRTVLLIVLVLPFVATAARADLADDIAAAKQALTDRISALNGIGDPTKDDQKENKKLQKALEKLAEYLGVDDAKDLKQCLKSMKLILKSRTVDGDVTDALEDIKDALDAIAGEIRVEAVALLPTVREEKKGTVQKRIGKGDAKRIAGNGFWPTDPIKCAKNLVKAIALFRDAVARAKKFEDEPPAPTADVYLYGTNLFNNTLAEIRITDFTYRVYGTLGGQPYDFGGKASDTHPHLLPIAVASKGHYDVLPVLTTLVNSDPFRPKLIPGDVVGTSYTIHTTAGDISSP